MTVAVAWCLGSDCQNCGLSAVAVHRWSSISCRGAEAGSHGPCDHKVSTVARGYGVDARLLLCVRFPCRGAEAGSHGPVCSEDHRDSSVAPQHGDGCPCCAGRRVPSAVVEETAVRLHEA